MRTVFSTLADPWAGPAERHFPQAWLREDSAVMGEGAGE